MTYNILNYRNFTSYCTSSNNNPITKEAALREVIAYAQPDLLVCNEVGGATPAAHEKILTDVLNTGGTTRWASTSYANNGFSTLVNGVYYDQTKLGIKREGMVSKSLSNVDLVRVLDVVQFTTRIRFCPSIPTRCFLPWWLPISKRAPLPPTWPTGPPPPRR